MKTTGNVPDFDNLSDLGLLNIGTAHWNLSTEKLSEITIANEMGESLFIWCYFSEHRKIYWQISKRQIYCER